MQIRLGRFEVEGTLRGGASLFVRAGRREFAIDRSGYRPATPLAIELWQASAGALHVFVAGWRILCCTAAGDRAVRPRVA